MMHFSQKEIKTRVEYSAYTLLSQPYKNSAMRSLKPPLPDTNHLTTVFSICFLLARQLSYRYYLSVSLKLGNKSIARIRSIDSEVDLGVFFFRNVLRRNRIAVDEFFW